MRGGNTEATLVLADGPIEAPPTVRDTWSAIVMHHDYWDAGAATAAPGQRGARQHVGVRGRRSTRAYAVDRASPATDLAVDARQHHDAPRW